MPNRLNALATRDTSIHLLWVKYSTTWTCTIERAGENLELRISVEADTAEEAVGRAIDKFERAINKGLPELQKAIEYKATDDEEIPF